VTLFKGIRWYLDDNVFVEMIHDDDAGLILRRETDGPAAGIHASSKCIYVNNVADGAVDALCSSITTRLSFLFNVFRESAPASCSTIFVIGGKRRRSVVKVYNAEHMSAGSPASSASYRIKRDTKQATITSFYKALTAACEKASNLVLTLDRYNSSLLRTHLHDKIVDITVALESLIEGENEIAFQVALFTSLVAKRVAAERTSSFTLLKKLYSARSKIVHGAEIAEKHILPVKESWDEVVAIATAAIT